MKDEISTALFYIPLFVLGWIIESEYKIIAKILELIK